MSRTSLACDRSIKVCYILQVGPGSNTNMAESKATSSNHQLYVQTPLLRSRKLSDLVGANVWLKMETVQTSGSFKSRGLSLFATKVRYQ